MPAPVIEPDKGPPDDLTRIRGISPPLARQLAVLGVAHYSTIAAWRAADVHTVSAALGLGRRISRENWIEQAALLQARARAPDATLAATIQDTWKTEPPPAAQTATTETPSIDLPEILAAIGNDANANDIAPPPVAPSAETRPRGAAEPVAASSLDDQTVAAASPLPQEDEVEPIVSADAPAGAPPALVMQESSSTTVAVSPRVADDAARQLEEEGWRAGPDAAEPTEAIVTFVIKEPVRSGSQAGNVPAVTAGASRASRLDPAADGPHEAYAPPDNRIDEAEVEILGQGRQKGAGASATRPTRTVQRLLRTLTGD